ncbi:MAG TPA: hypothetical protein VK469_03360 [Candidatus Kapabacteria bacterium]|nr:hypothetical protein [Candidatus Kapabacteria bacterium]
MRKMLKSMTTEIQAGRRNKGWLILNDPAEEKLHFIWEVKGIRPENDYQKG